MPSGSKLKGERPPVTNRGTAQQLLRYAAGAIPDTQRRALELRRRFRVEGTNDHSSNSPVAGIVASRVSKSATCPSEECMRNPREHHVKQPSLVRQSCDRIKMRWIVMAMVFGVRCLVGSTIVGCGDPAGPQLLDAQPPQPGCVEEPLIPSSGTFGGRTDLIAGGNPYAAVAADLDGDCSLDLVIVNADDKTLGVFRGRSDGTFAGQVTTPLTGSFSATLVVADFDGDGNPDVAVGFGSSVGVLLGNGDGTFRPQTTYTVTEFGLVSGDFDGDGDIDIATSYGGLLTNAGDGTFTVSMLGLEGTMIATNGSSAIAAADLDGDHQLDLAIGTYDVPQPGTLVGEVAIFRNTGAGFATAVLFPTGGGPSGIAIGDLDRDGILDLAMTTGIDTLTTLRGTGGASFAAPMANTATEGYEYSAIAVGDINGDGAPDITTNNRIDYIPQPAPASTVSVYLNDGSGGFGTPSYVGVRVQPSAVLLRDLDRDGRLDLVSVNQSGTVSVLRGSP